MRCRMQQQPILYLRAPCVGERHPDESVGPTPTVPAKVPSEKKSKRLIFFPPKKKRTFWCCSGDVLPLLLYTAVICFNGRHYSFSMCVYAGRVPRWSSKLTLYVYRVQTFFQLYHFDYLVSSTCVCSSNTRAIRYRRLRVKVWSQESLRDCRKRKIVDISTERKKLLVFLGHLITVTLRNVAYLLKSCIFSSSCISTLQEAFGSCIHLVSNSVWTHERS